jgi:hypothetical protein
MHGNSNPSGPDPHGPYAGTDKQTGEPLNPNHWDYLR